jgi:hypothetical protein
MLTCVAHLRRVLSSKKNGTPEEVPALFICWCERSHPQIRPSETPGLIVIWMTVAPVPVIVLIRMFPMLVGKISLVAFVLVGPVCVILAVVPVVIVVVPRIVDTDLDMFIVGRRGSESGAACRKGRRQEKCGYV